MSIYAVIDFETTGMSPALGARATEVAVVLVDNGCVVDRYQSLMNAGAFIPYEIQALTGITNAMIRSAPPAEEVMREAADFVGAYPLVAHNAAFDRKFWDAELQRVGRRSAADFVCSLLLSRRLVPEAPNHKLATLVSTLRLPATGRYHRALADAEATANLFLHLSQTLAQRFCLAGLSLELLLAVQRTPRVQLERCVERFRDQLGVVAV